jgi:hypothetical protein
MKYKLIWAMIMSFYPTTADPIRPILTHPDPSRPILTNQSRSLYQTCCDNYYLSECVTLSVQIIISDILWQSLLGYIHEIIWGQIVITHWSWVMFGWLKSDNHYLAIVTLVIRKSVFLTSCKPCYVILYFLSLQGCGGNDSQVFIPYILSQPNSTSTAVGACLNNG